MKLAIIAGGKGARLGLGDIPKPMVSLGGAPLLEHQILLAKQYGIDEIFVLSGFRAQSIIDHFGDGSKFGVSITHIIEDSALGTAGAVRQLKDEIHERFMVFYGDVLLNLDLSLFIDFDRKAKSIATIIVHPNDHPYDSDLVEVDRACRVTAFHPKPHRDGSFYRNLVNAAVYILDPSIFRSIPKEKPTDFGKDIFPSLLDRGQVIRAYNTAEYVKDLGTQDRLAAVRADFSTGKVARWSKKDKRPAVFLDRDGTLIENVPLLYKPEDLKFYPFSAAAISKLNHSDFLSLLVTNQPVVARNLCDMEIIENIHNKLESLLGEAGAYLNDIYFCPHHPDKGYPEENKALKLNCDCRKPKIGMIERAVKAYNIDLNSSWIVGDTTVDIETGINAGIGTILVRTGEGGKDRRFCCEPDFVFDDLEDAVHFILEDREAYLRFANEIVEFVTESCERLPTIISIGGQARSGKSTFVRLLVRSLKEKGLETTVISLDDWLLGQEGRTAEMTVRERYQYEKMEADLEMLIKDGTISVGRYDPLSRKVCGKKHLSLNGAKCLIVEGVPALDTEVLRRLSCVKVYIEVDEIKRKKRFLSFYQWKGLSEGEALQLYSDRLRDEVSIITPSKVYADFVVQV